MFARCFFSYCVLFFLFYFSFNYWYLCLNICNRNRCSSIVPSNIINIISTNTYFCIWINFFNCSNYICHYANTSNNVTLLK
uniref:Uncharacterized protein n=1 Tax=uncultured marine virus TaxID=186617 RepID=A0A0F7L483_9VIRU|nr:hypothetical protein [uncultured marine virus]